MNILRSLFYFFFTGLCEIGGGYLVWLWLREGKSIKYALVGWLILMLYGVLPTFQPANFGRVYSAYGGAFVVFSLLWGWKIDRIPPDRYDWLGVVFILIGAGVIMYAPRS
ncbi:MAG: YnfA family protein [Cyanobacteria bacterium J083]|nr:MAG: YnfA family protein [Cyanobacteria bacterium J083]